LTSPPTTLPSRPGAIYHLDTTQLDAAPPGATHPGAGLDAACDQAAALGFDAICLTGARPDAAAIAAQHGLVLLLDADMEAPGPADPTAPPDPRFRDDHATAQDPQAWLERWRIRLAQAAAAGAAGFRCILPGWLDAAILRDLTQSLRATTPGLLLIACIRRPSQPTEGFDLVAPLLPWREALATPRTTAPLLAFAEIPGGPRLAARWNDRRLAERAARQAVQLAALSGQAWLMPAGFEHGALHREDLGHGPWQRTRYDLTEAVKQANAARTGLPALAQGHPRLLSAPHAPLALLWQDSATPGRALVLANPSLLRPARLSAGQVLGLLPEPGTLPPGVFDAEGRLSLAPAEVLMLPVHAAAPVRLPLPEGTDAAAHATEAPRIAIEAIAPAVDAGRFPVKRSVGQAVTVTADVFADGHAKIAVSLLWRPADESEWREIPMTPTGNDVWEASFVPDRIGRHVYTIESWVDEYAAFQDEITKKHKAGVDVTLERREGAALVEAAIARLGAAGEPLAAMLRQMEGTSHQQAVALFNAPETRALMERADTRPHRIQQEPLLPLDIERRAAGFSSWYEIFPRSQSGDAHRHGTFADVIGALPRVRDMGFDVLYFPPIHPIGEKNRKGRNNTLTPEPDDVGSPYAIGAAEGGHDALHPELGTLEDFRALVAAAKEHGLELALDFAIQCSPDHPWLKEHPDWFDWRPDGTIRYAENPPKKYEDIVNVDFYTEGAKPALWLALRDVVLFWVKEGVKLFRVDNPHTKPLPFWEWMIGEVRARAPEAVFLSEAFTRPKVMYRLAKVGFSQSYTYFTWRNTRWEMTQYLQELNEAPVSDFFRPHFFVNTPDINPEFLHHSGRPGHLIRAALAATLSGLWGVYNGFELCEATPVRPGKEEYLDSEKYEIRAWDYDRPGNITAEITRLNHIRRENPALQTHLGFTALASGHENVMLYLKATPEGDNAILVAVSMDPYQAAEMHIELPQYQLGLPNGAGLLAENLMDGGEERWDGSHRYLRLDPYRRPFAIWRVRAADKA
jgi:starch synthase (maltosyl-transferring)